MQEQTYPSPRADSAPMPAADDEQARREWKRQLDRMLDEYRSRFVLHDEPGNENLNDTEYEDG